MNDELWPALPYEAWRPTKDTLQMKAQAIGKLRLALSPFEPGWANVPLYVTARGLNTSPLRHSSGEIFDVDVDLRDHTVRIRTGSGDVREVALRARPVAEFYADLRAQLAAAGVDVDVSETPSEVPDPIPFPDDTTHRDYDPDAVARFHRVLLSVDAVFKEHRAQFRGRASVVHFFWGSFDLAVTRFSGRPAEPYGDDVIMRRSTDAEQFCVGFWPGDARYPAPAFFAYAYPQPPGVEGREHWSEQLGEFVLPYDEVRASRDPRQALLEFLERTYAAAGWDAALTAPVPA